MAQDRDRNISNITKHVRQGVPRPPEVVVDSYLPAFAVTIGKAAGKIMDGSQMWQSNTYDPTDLAEPSVLNTTSVHGVKQSDSYEPVNPAEPDVGNSAFVPPSSSNFLDLSRSVKQSDSYEPVNLAEPNLLNTTSVPGSSANLVACDLPVKQSDSYEPDIWNSAFVPPSSSNLLDLSHPVKQSDSYEPVNLAEPDVWNSSFVPPSSSNLLDLSHPVKQSDSYEPVNLAEPDVWNSSFVPPSSSNLSHPVKQSHSYEPVNLDEPSVLNRRLNEEREYNCDNWSSAELRKMHGVGDGPMDYIANATGRSLREVWSKYEEINVINSENNDDRMDAEVNDWVENDPSLSKEGSKRNEKTLGLGNVFRWSSAVQHVNLTRPGFQSNVSRKAIEEIMTTLPEPRHLTNVKINTKHPQLHLSHNVEAELNWERVYDFVGRILTGQSHAVGKLNSLEAGIILEMLDDIEREAMEVLDYKEETAIIRGLLTKIYQKDFRNFEPEVPCNELSATGIYVDPLRTRKWRIPQGGSILTREDLDKYENQIHNEDGTLQGMQESNMNGGEDGHSFVYTDDSSPQSTRPESDMPLERIPSRAGDFEIED